MIDGLNALLYTASDDTLIGIAVIVSICGAVAGILLATVCKLPKDAE